jgi:uncharacterized iron-regulated membrane protein
MLRKLVIHGFFLVLPFALYGVWLWVQRRRAKAAGAVEAPKWADAPLAWLSTVGLVLLILSFIVMSQLGRFEPGGTYTPPRLGEDGEIIPAETK